MHLQLLHLLIFRLFSWMLPEQYDAMKIIGISSSFQNAHNFLFPTKSSSLIFTRKIYLPILRLQYSNILFLASM